MPDLNTAPQPVSRQPKGAVKLNGTVMPGWVSLEVDNNVFRAADTFRAEFAISLLPSDRNAVWLATQKDMSIEIFATPDCPGTYTPASSDSLILGQVDHLEYDPTTRRLSLSGRDYTAKLIDTKTSEQFSEQTSSQIATTLAGRHGLTPVVTATTTKVGVYYNSDHVEVSQERSEWDLLCYLAGKEGFVVYVKGNELHFEPPQPESGNNYVITWAEPTSAEAYFSGSVIDLAFSRDLTIAKGIVVTVRSWNAQQGKAFTASWPKSASTASTKPGQAAATTTAYNFTVAGLTMDQALAYAQKQYAIIVAHAVKLTATLPADAILDCTKTLQVRGTGTTFDQVYYPDSVKRSMSVDEGFRMEVSAKNVNSDGGAAE